jgi:mannitol/fructose-specific phosphotransferase system IIA component (Ntr-type)
METSREKYVEFLEEATTISLFSKTKYEILNEIVKNTPQIKEKYHKDIVQLLIDRENAGSTVIAPKVALAHVETDLVDQLVLSCAFSKEGIYNWSFHEAGEKLKIIFMLLFPQKINRDLYIEIVKQLMIQFSDDKLLINIANVQNANEIKLTLINNKLQN